VWLTTDALQIQSRHSRRLRANKFLSSGIAAH
jgi:hypothetical protein